MYCDRLDVPLHFVPVLAMSCWDPLWAGRGLYVRFDTGLRIIMAKAIELGAPIATPSTGERVGDRQAEWTRVKPVSGRSPEHD
jgi:hypothetical protein